MSCRVCGDNKEKRLGVCFDCASFESLIHEKLDMYDRPISKTIEGSESLNILKSIIDYARNKDKQKDEVKCV